jgi:hypothetical protein
MRKLYYTVLGPIPNGFVIIAAYPTYDEAYRLALTNQSYFMGEPLTQEEAEQRGLITLAAVEGDPLRKVA